MQTQPHLSSAFASAAARFTPPAHVKRWTGRAVPTILLPDLAALRIAGAGEASARNQTRLARA